MPSPNPAELHPHDPAWPITAAGELARISAALDGLGPAEFDHIGSTSVPGLRAKPFIDLQVRIDPLPDEAALAARLEPLGYRMALGSRPDSPGVTRDIPRGGEPVADEVWQKRLLTSADVPAILHIRRMDSPWGRYTVWFRDWLRANPEARARYEAVKLQLSAENAGKPDYDDYTRAKSAFFDEVQGAFTAWAAR
ncbi:GrpB family protein [Microbacterium gilvum]|uniref:GrpB family protein n=1 Tax=Microbacterium gilvum TaxID=1336204 RepID=A0ABP8ZXG5_9MICO